MRFAIWQSRPWFDAATPTCTDSMRRRRTGMQHADDKQAKLKAELSAASEELKAHMASWEYAFAMAGSRDGAGDHPLHWETRARTERLLRRCHDLRARLAEFEP